MQARTAIKGKQVLPCRKAKLQKEIEKLEKQARNEKQPNKKFQLAQHVKELKRQVENLQ